MRVQCLDARRVGSEEDISLQAGRQVGRQVAVAVAVQVAPQAVVVQILQSLRNNMYVHVSQTSQTSQRASQ